MWLSSTWNVVVQLRNRICTCSFNSHMWSVATILDSASLEKFSASRRFRVIWCPITSAHLLFSSSPTHSSHPGLLEVPQIHLACPISAWLLPLPPSDLCLSVTISETPTLALPETPNLPCPALPFPTSLLIADMIYYGYYYYDLSTALSLRSLSAMKNLFVSFVDWCVPKPSIVPEIVTQ